MFYIMHKNYFLSVEIRKYLRSSNLMVGDKHP